MKTLAISFFVLMTLCFVPAFPVLAQNASLPPKTSQSDSSLAVVSQSTQSNTQQGPDSHVFPSVQRSQLTDLLKGRVLVEELNCIACHQTSSESLRSASKNAPRLREVGRRANAQYLNKFISAPHRVKPGTSMPDVLSHLTDQERKDTAKALTHFIVSLNRSGEFRFDVPDSIAAEVGHDLFHHSGCAACHSPRDASGKETMQSDSVPLGDLENKYSVSSLTNFLADPLRVRPSGRMPSLNLPRRQYEQIANYLLQKTKVPGHLKYRLLTGRVWEGLEVNVKKERAGHVDNFDLKKINRLPHNSAVIYEGFLNSKTDATVTFHVEWNGGELWINEHQVIELEPSSRRSVKKSSAQVELVRGWNQIKLVYIHAGREPRFNFEIEESGQPRRQITPAELSISLEPIEPLAPYKLDRDLIRQGAEAFVNHNCYQCHDDVKQMIPSDIEIPEALPALTELDLQDGCLQLQPTQGRTRQTNSSPQYHLSDSQRKMLQLAIPKLESQQLDPASQVAKSLVTFNCITCHERQGLGGISPARNQLFVGDNNELGNEGRIPPPLTLVGAKLKKHWISEVLLRGQRQRNYLATRMPLFGESNVGHLVELFEKVDSIESVQFEKIKDVSEVKAAGHRLIGTKGFSCIACHDFNGQKAAGPGALDIIHSHDRLKKDWFYEFMLKPSRFRKGTVMPASWPGGHVFLEDILDGDAKKQIESVWVYLEDGVRAKNPEGLSRKSPELRVADTTLICRGRGTAGYRGMGVGYPERISLAFDTQEMALRLLWKGEFATVDNGRFSARGRDRITFPAGIPFHRLKSLDDNWPYKRKTDYLFPQDHGYRFHGYSLDKDQRPTLLYQYGKIVVKDFFRDQLDSQKKAYFKRSLTFETPAEPEDFYFRVASGKSITRLSATSYKIDRLTVSFRGGNGAVIRQGSPQELLIRLKLPKGISQLELEYKW